jgi:hypothetical protein
MGALTAIIPTIERPSLVRAIRSVRWQTVATTLLVERDPSRTGTASTLNRALPKVETDWVCTLGDDDVLDPHFAEWLTMHADQVDLLIFLMRFPNGFTIPPTQDVAELKHGLVGASYAVRTELVRELGGWHKAPPEVRRETSSEDWMMIATARDMGARLRVVPQVAYYAKHNPFSTSAESVG